MKKCAVSVKARKTLALHPCRPLHPPPQPPPPLLLPPLPLLLPLFPALLLLPPLLLSSFLISPTSFLSPSSAPSLSSSSSCPCPSSSSIPRKKRAEVLCFGVDMRILSLSPDEFHHEKLLLAPTKTHSIFGDIPLFSLFFFSSFLY